MVAVSACSQKSGKTKKVSKAQSYNDTTKSTLKIEFIKKVSVQYDSYITGFYKFISPGHFFAFSKPYNRRPDLNPGIREFKNYAFVREIGKIGKGTCEYNTINNYVVNNNKLYLIDYTFKKLLIYNLLDSNYKKCTAIVDSTFQTIYGIEVLAGKPYLIWTLYKKSSKQDTPVIYSINKENMKVTHEEFTIRDLKINVPYFSSYGRMPTDNRAGKIYFYPDLTQKIFIYTPETKTLKSLKVDIYVAEDKGIYGIENVEKAVKIINNSVEVVYELFALEHGIAVAYSKEKYGEEIFGVKIFNYSGEFIAEQVFENEVIYMKKGKIMTLIVDPNLKYPYSFKVFKYSF